MKFSEYFSLMKCVGEVALHEDAVSGAICDRPREKVV